MFLFNVSLKEFQKGIKNLAGGTHQFLLWRLLLESWLVYSIKISFLVGKYQGKIRSHGALIMGIAFLGIFINGSALH